MGASLLWLAMQLDQDAKSCGTVLELVRDACPSNGSLPGRNNNKVGSLLLFAMLSMATGGRARAFLVMVLWSGECGRSRGAIV